MNKPLPKKRRKEALQNRALAYAERLKREQELTPVNVVMNAYEDGYRAAMRDARAAWNSEPSHTMATIALLDFIKPLK